MERGDSPAALGHRWWHVHSELEQRVSTLLAALEHEPRNEAAAALEELRVSLLAHFEIEESAYFGLVSRLRPDLAPAVALAREAHASMLASCEQLRACLPRADRTTATARLNDLLARFHAHEEQELTLIRALEHSRSTASDSGS